MGELKWWHIVIVLAIFMLLFGYKRLPSATKSIAQSLKIFKDETKGLRDDHDDHAAATSEPAERSAVPSLEKAPSTTGAVPAPVTIPAPPAAQPAPTTQPAAAVAPQPAQSLAPKPTSR